MSRQPPIPNQPLEQGNAPLLAGGLIVLAALIVYSNSFSGPFIFDDTYATTKNPSIRHLWQIWNVLAPPGDSPTGGRPILNLSFALNYALGGFHVAGYHAFNLLVHILTGLTLFGVVRRTLQKPVVRGRFGAEALPLALAVALLWVVHPAQTEAVTYISQRAESMMGLFYLLTLYCFIRACEESEWRRLWPVLCVGSCLLGMATKEVMVTAPLMVLVYDRTFVAGTFREAWRQRGRFYGALAATWGMLLEAVLLQEKRREETDYGVTPWNYALTECQAIVHYLGLTVWPHPLVLDYGSNVVNDLTDVAPHALILALLLTVTLIAFFRWPVAGFAGIWFFIILAPTSSVIPIVGQPVADHRLYLPLAAFVTLLVLGLHTILGKNSRHVFLGLVVMWGILTFQRNEVYRTGLSIWSETVKQSPNSARAHELYGCALLETQKFPEAIDQFQQSIQLSPVEASAYYNRGIALFQTKKLPEAIEQFKEALRLKSNDADTNNYMGIALAQSGRPSDSIPYFQNALELAPDHAEIHNNWGIALIMLGRKPEAIQQFQEALRLDPDYSQAEKNLAEFNTPATGVPGKSTVSPTMQ